MPEPAVSRQDIIARIDALQPSLPGLSVRRLSLFGSAARDELGPASDVDILVEFDGPARLEPFLDLLDLLQEQLGRRVDLVTTRALDERLRRYIEPDLLRVA